MAVSLGYVRLRSANIYSHHHNLATPNPSLRLNNRIRRYRHHPHRRVTPPRMLWGGAGGGVEKAGGWGSKTRSHISSFPSVLLGALGGKNLCVLRAFVVKPKTANIHSPRQTPNHATLIPCPHLIHRSAEHHGTEKHPPVPTPITALSYPQSQRRQGIRPWHKSETHWRTARQSILMLSPDVIHRPHRRVTPPECLRGVSPIEMGGAWKVG